MTSMTNFEVWNGPPVFRGQNKVEILPEWPVLRFETVPPFSGVSKNKVEIWPEWPVLKFETVPPFLGVGQNKVDI